MKLSVMVTFEDQVIVYGTWGRVGVWQMLDRMHRAGVDRVYWRSRGNGQAEYPSRITETKLTIYPDEVHNDMVTIADGGHDWINATVNFDEFDHFLGEQRFRFIAFPAEGVGRIPVVEARVAVDA